MARKRRTPQENYAITQKIEQLEREGIETNRAIAAAFRMWKEGELDPNVSSKKKRQQQRAKKARRTRRRRHNAFVSLSILEAIRNVNRIRRQAKAKTPKKG